MSDELVRGILAMVMLVALLLLVDRTTKQAVLKMQADIEPFEVWIAARYFVVNNEYSLKCYPHTTCSLRAVRRLYEQYVRHEIRMVKGRIETKKRSRL